MEKDRLVAFIISSLLKYVNGKSICFYLESVIVPAVNEVLSRLKVEHLFQVFRSTSEIIVSGMLSREGDIILDSINCRHLRYQVTLTLSLSSFFVHRHRHYNFVWFFTFFGVLFSSSIHNKHFFLAVFCLLFAWHTRLCYSGIIECSSLLKFEQNDTFCANVKLEHFHHTTNTKSHTTTMLDTFNECERDKRAEKMTKTCISLNCCCCLMMYKYSCIWSDAPFQNEWKGKQINFYMWRELVVR